MRNTKRLAEIRKLPCVRCGNPPPSEAMFEKWLVKTELMMRKDGEVF